MTKPTIGTREEWRTARLALLEAEKELTRRGDELARQRQRKAKRHWPICSAVGLS
jgi:predicted dithiol-disulfide oxidoreductase (DUF899 family)